MTPTETYLHLGQFIKFWCSYTDMEKSIHAAYKHGRIDHSLGEPVCERDKIVPLLTVTFPVADKKDLRTWRFSFSCLADGAQTIEISADSV